MALKDNLVSYYKFDENANTNATDATGTHTLTQTGNVGKITTGKINSARGPVNASNYFSKANMLGTINGRSSFTFTLWFKRPASWASGNDVPFILFVGKTGTSDVSLRIGQWSKANNTVSCQYRVGTTSYTSGPVEFTDTGWNFLAGRFDDGYVTMWINDSKEDTSSRADAGNNTAGDTYVGKWAGATYSFEGDVDELAIWSRALDDEEVEAVYNSGNGLSYENIILQKVSLSDSIALQDSDVKKFSRTRSDAVKLVDVLSKKKSSNKVFSESISLVDVVTKSKSVVKSFSDSINLNDVVDAKRTAVKSISDVVSLDESVSKSYDGVRSFSEEVDLLDADNRDAFKKLDDSLVLVDSFTAKNSKIFLDTISLDDSIEKDYTGKRSFSDEISLVDVVNKEVSKKAFEDVVSLDDSLKLKQGKTFTDSVSLNDSSESEGEFYRTLVDSVSLVDEVDPLQRYFKISGNVQLRGSDLEGATVRLMNIDSGSYVGETLTDVNGNYEFTKVYENVKYHVTVEYFDGALYYNDYSKPFVIPVEV
jgi:hypothetical protein